MTTDQDDTRFPADDSDDSSYFQRRAEWHEGRAKVAEDSSTRSLHLRFARLYAARAAS
ncbi:hypothetical protein C8J25_105255 [Sphingomonas faeni]|uniref:Uncharacterized protein n=1 Tax=Sphingomonas faeni TaxID=185950 RepID=A0A2T5U4Q6_9SPHN|nr:hypothetical protein [Sphingomonas faeni]PTW46474.1 hypothetical protein C8J25_105255 [Sphingomonas faeni]